MNLVKDLEFIVSEIIQSSESTLDKKEVQLTEHVSHPSATVKEDTLCNVATSSQLTYPTWKDCLVKGS